MAARTISPTDLTGTRKLELEKARDKAKAEEAEARVDQHQAEQIARENDVLDVTGHPDLPVIVDPVEVVDDQADESEVIRVIEDLEDVTIANVTYNFKAGTKYKVPRHVADRLREKGRVYARA